MPDLLSVGLLEWYCGQRLPLAASQLTTVELNSVYGDVRSH
ncbi:MAG: hypothetical protein AAF722_18860 [Cyanobacteria bacterium P01_C01_bin.70]